MAVMASAINFNTVWTSIFEPLPTFGFLDRLGKERVGRPPRAAVPHRRFDASGVVVRVGSAVRNWKPGDRVTVHCNHPTTRIPGPRRLDARRQPAHLGLRDQLGGLADLALLVKANQLMPKPTHLTWEEARNALCNSTSYRMIKVSKHAGDLSRARPGPSATGGIGGYAVQYVLNGGGTPVGVVPVAGAGQDPQRDGLRARHRPQGGPATSSGRTSTPRTRRSGAGSARTSAGSSRPRRRHRLRAPGVGRPSAPRSSPRPAAARRHHHLRRHVRLHDRVRQPPPLDEAEADRLLALRELPGGLERQPAHLRGQAARGQQTSLGNRTATMPSSARSARTRSPCSSATTAASSGAPPSSSSTA